MNIAADLITEVNLSFQSLEAVSRFRETQLQVTKNLCDLKNLSLNILYQC